MKAISIAQTLPDSTRERIGASPIIRPRFALTTGKVYLVLGLYTPLSSSIFGRTTLYRIIDDDGTCIVCPMGLFEICDGRPSKFWRAHIIGDDFYLYPDSFFKQYFFDDLAERLPAIVSEFDATVSLLDMEAEELPRPAR